MASSGSYVLGIDCGFDRFEICRCESSGKTQISAGLLNSASLRAHLANVCPRGIDGLAAVAVGLGPGKFSSIRTGMAFAQGLARGSGARIYGATLFEMLSLVAPETTKTIVSSGGARRAFSQKMTVQDLRLAPLGDPRAASAQDETGAWRDPRDQGLALTQPAAMLLARIANARAAAGTGSSAGDLHPLYVAEPSLGPAPGHRGRR